MTEQTFTELFHAYRPMVHRIVRRKTGCNVTADDAVQEIFLKVWSRREGTVINDIRFYLARAAVNFVTDRNKTVRRSAPLRLNGHELTVADSRTPELQVLSEEFEAVTDALLSTLSVRQREALDMVSSEGADNKLIADRLSIRPLTVKKHLLLARREMRVRIRRYLN